MGVDVILQDGAGRKFEMIGDPQNRIARMIPSLKGPGFSYLNRVDTYGDTWFNRWQAVDLLKEWDLLVTDSYDAESRKLYSDVRSLIVRVSKSVNVYLYFSGD
jgi:hypothetical protein